MEEKDGYGKKEDCCRGEEGSGGEVRSGLGHRRMLQHGAGMMLCCLAPLAILAMVPLLGLRQGGALSFLSALICPIGMGVMMFSMSRMGKGGACHGTKEKEIEG